MKKRLIFLCAAIALCIGGSALASSGVLEREDGQTLEFAPIVAALEPEAETPPEADLDELLHVVKNQMMENLEEGEEIDDFEITASQTEDGLVYYSYAGMSLYNAGAESRAVAHIAEDGTVYYTSEGGEGGEGGADAEGGEGGETGGPWKGDDTGLTDGLPKPPVSFNGFAEDGSYAAVISGADKDMFLEYAGQLQDAGVQGEAEDNSAFGFEIYEFYGSHPDGREIILSLVDGMMAVEVYPG